MKKKLQTISADTPKARQAKPENANNESLFSARYSGWLSIQIKVHHPQPPAFSIKQNRVFTAVVILRERLFSHLEQRTNLRE